MKLEEQFWITFGITKLEKTKFKEIISWKNHRSKPRLGGIWSSPVDSSYGWKEFCEDHDYNIKDLNKWIKFRLIPGTKLYIINSLEDLNNIPRIDLEVLNYGIPSYTPKFCIDYSELIRQGYDGVYLTFDGFKRTNDYLSEELVSIFGWDCESMILFNIENIDLSSLISAEGLCEDP